MDQDIYSEVLRAIGNRGVWEQRQDTWYKTRFTGLRRTSVPYQGAPDTHYPLVDTIIEKMRPFYGQQIYVDLVCATFVCDNSLAREQIVNCEQWFDYQMKQRSNFEPAMMQTIDYMLLRGFCPTKVYWDTDKNRLAFDAVDPLYIIVPEYTEDKPDWLIQVKRFSKAKYKLQKDYNQDEDFVNSISGGGEQSTRVGTIYEQTKANREGITYTSDKNAIIVWECYTFEDGKWCVEELAPTLGNDGEPVKAKMGLPTPYDDIPYTVFLNDNSQRGWYASRGVAEILALHELALNKNWNSQLQFLDFFGHPQYKNTGLTPINSSNFQGKPGMILPQGVDYATPPGIPPDFQQQMQFVRALAEDRIVIPDLSSGEHLVGPRSVSGKITATQTSAIMALSNQSNDLRSRMFRMQLGMLYNKAWKLLRYYASGQLNFIFENSSNQLDPQLLGPNYQYNIVPSGSADSWNKQQRISDAIQIYQFLKGDPNVNQLELDKFLLESKDPRLNNRLIQSSGMQSMKQAEKQAVETTVMLQGRPMTTDPSDDDAAHLQDIQGTIQRRMQTGEPLTGEFMQLALQHSAQHVNQMKQKKNPQASQFAQQLGQATKLVQQAMAHQQAMGPQMPQAPMNAALQQPQGQGQGGKSPSEQINYKDAPPSIRRQMEQQAGMQPATPQEGAMELANELPKGMQPQPGAQPQAQGQPSMPSAPQPPSQPQAMPSINLNVPPVQFDMNQLSQALAQVLAAHRPPDVHVHVPEQQAPVVHVQAPSPTLPPPAPVVHVEPPQVHVSSNKKSKKRIKIERNPKGDITGAQVEEQ